MSFAITETQTMLGDMLGRLLDAESDFEARRHRLSGDSPERLALWRLLAEQGILGAAFPEACGGFGGTKRDLAVVMAEVGRKLVVEPVLMAAVCGRILQKGDETEEIARIIAGDRIYAFAHEEGFDPFVFPAVAADDDHRLNGRKIAVRHGDIAGALIVSASLAGARACFLVEADAFGVDRDGYRLIDGSSAATITFNNTPARLIAGAEALDDALEWGLIGLAAEVSGIVAALNEATFSYLRTRQQFGVTLSSFQALQHRAADMFAAAEEIRALCGRAIDGEGVADAALASAAKALADDGGKRIGHDAVQLHGGMGVSDELHVSHHMRRLAAIRAELGSADIHRTRFAARHTASDVASSWRKEVRAFTLEHLPPDLAHKGELGLMIEKDDYVRWQKILRQQGWFAAAWPTEYGGAGWDLEKQLTFLQEAALNNAPMISPYGVNMVGPVLQEFGTDAQKEKYLPGILANETWWCQGYSEPNSGSDLASLKTTAIRHGDHYVVNGTKMWTTEAHWADMMHCLVRTDREVKAQRGISFLLIDMKTPGITINPIVTIDGQHHTNQTFFDDVRVPVENLVGGEGQGWTIAKFLLSHERVAIADTGPKLRLLAHIKAMLAAISKSPTMNLLSQKLADAEIQLLSLCALEESYVKMWADSGSKEGPQASILKIRGTEILQRLSEIALEIEGPMGAAHDPRDLHRNPEGNFSPAQRASLMAHQYLYGRCWSIFGGTNEVQRNIIARSLLQA
jgi:alkylation response protein AidB-like acyl-CoA dehydrogenase